MEKLLFEPLDTLFFRDGSPFNQGEGNFGVESLFPPSPLTLVGAARVAWARNKGWSGKGRWLDQIGTNLGGDGDVLDGLHFRGPMLELDKEAIFPVPATLTGKTVSGSSPQNIALLKPGPVLRCDLGDVRLPVPNVPDHDRIEGRKLLDGWWLTRSGFGRVLQGKLPQRSDFVSQSCLWSNESKVGNQIRPETGVTEEGMLYSTRHIRLNPRVRLVMGIKAELDGFPSETLVALGGEARGCWLKRENSGLGLPLPSVFVHRNKLQYAVHILSPLNPEHPPEPGQPFEGLPGKIISACLRPLNDGAVGDSTRFEPLPMKPHLAPGSVLFLEADTSDKQRIVTLHGKNIGQRSSWGFGLIAIGEWK